MPLVRQARRRQAAGRVSLSGGGPPPRPPVGLAEDVQMDPCVPGGLASGRG